MTTAPVTAPVTATATQRFLIGNAFSLGMLDCLREGPVGVSCSQISEQEAREWVVAHSPESCVGHADTALLLSGILGVLVEMRRVSTSLAVGDSLLVAQYNGPRLPEGATALPEGAGIRWILATVA